MFKKVLIGLLVLVIVFVVIVALQPSSWLMSRSAVMAAPPAAVFEQLNDFHQWEKWSPWIERDPSTKGTYEGPDAGVGAKFSWTSNHLGSGDMTIIESRPNEMVRLDLHFIKPMEGRADTLFTIEPKGEQSKVTWSMKGRNGFIEKAMCLFMNMDTMVGGDFEKGLANMKAIVESDRKH